MKELIIIFMAIAPFVFAGDRLINGDFSGGLANWTVRQPEITSLDPAICISAPGALRLDGTTFISQPLDLELHTVYEISGYMKGEGISGDANAGARIILEGNQKWKRVVPNDEGNAETGTFDWKFFRTTFTPDDLNSARIIVHCDLHGTGTVWYDDLQVVKKTLTPPPVPVQTAESFRVPHNGGLGWVTFWALGERGFFAPGEPLRFSLKVNDAGKALRVEATLRDELGVERARATQDSFATPGTIELTFPGVEQGYYIATAELYEGETLLYAIQAGAAVFPPPVERDPYYALGFSAFQSLHDAYKYLGVGTINLKFQVTEFSQFNRDEAVAKFFKDYKPFLENGAFRLCFTYPFAIRRTARTEEELAQGWPLLPDAFLKEVIPAIRTIAERTKGLIQDWCVQQEIPSSATMTFKYCGTWSEAMMHQVIMTRMISRAVKAVDPANRVWTGGNNQADKVESIERLVMADLKGEVDGYLVDAYTGDWDLRHGENAMLPETRLLKFLRDSSSLSKSIGLGELIRNDETGYAIYYGAPYDHGMAWDQAELTARSMVIMRAAPVCLFELFTPNRWYPPGTQIPDDEMYMATCWRTVTDGKRVNHVPLPGGAMYATLAREFTFTIFHREIICDKLYCYVFTRGDGKTFAALWSTADPAEVRPALPADTRTLTMTGREGTLGTDAITLTHAPIYLVSDRPADEVADALEAAMLEVAPRFRLAVEPATTPDEVLLYILNCSSVTVPGLVIVDDGGAVPTQETVDDRGTVPTQETTGTVPGLVAASKSAPLEVNLLPQQTTAVTLPAGKTATLFADGQKYIIQLFYLQDSIKIKRIAEKPRFDGALAWTKGLTPIQLRHPDDIYPKTALHREKAYFRDELYNPDGHTFTADCYLAYDAECLYLAADVDDPTHIQHFAPEQAWRGDSLQFAFASRPVPPAEVRSPNTPDNIAELENNILVALKDGEVLRVRFGTSPEIVDFPAKVTRIEGHTRYEIALPWKLLGLTPETCQRLGMVLFDNNSPADQEPPYWLAFGQGIAGGQDAALLKPVKFE